MVDVGLCMAMCGYVGLCRAITGKKVKFQRGKSLEYSQFNIPCLGYQW